MAGLYKDPTAVSSPLIGKQCLNLLCQNSGIMKSNFRNRSLQERYPYSMFGRHGVWPVARSILCSLNCPNSKVVTVYGLNYKDEISEARRYLVEHGDPFEASAVDATGG